jgi:hypothetical protein
MQVKYNRRVVLTQFIRSIGVSLLVAPFAALAQGEFSAIPGQRGGQDMFGPYEVVEGWPQDISELPGHEAWTSGSGQSVFAESPDRVFLLHRGELPNIEAPAATVSRSWACAFVSGQAVTLAKRFGWSQSQFAGCA